MDFNQLPDLPEKSSDDAPPETIRNTGWINWHQGSILADRYLETILADWKSTGLLLVQAPLLAAMVVAVWGNVQQANAIMYFVMVLSAMWLGCTNACREIVKERALFLREKMVNLDVGAYLYSKLRVLMLVGAVQVGIYSLIIYKWLDVRVPIGWLMLNLFFTIICGTCLGLLISSFAKKSDVAVGMVPLVILPQILFSEFAIKKSAFSGFSEYIYLITPSRWGYESLFEYAQTSPDYLMASALMLPLLGLSAAFLLIAYPILRMQKY